MLSTLAAGGALAFSDAEILALRRETKVCETIIHFSNGSASPAPDVVADAVNSYLDLERSRGPYEAAEQQRGSLADFYDLASALIGASASEVAFTSGASSGWNMMLAGLNLREGDEIITHEDDYGSNHLAYLHLKKSKQIRIKIVENSDLGLVDLEALENAITERTKAVFLTHVCMQTGCIQPAEKVGQIARNKDVPFFLDAAQSIGQVPINVADLNCDVLVGSGRKYLRGPRGTGILYVAKSFQDIIEPPLANFASAVWTSESDFEWVNSAKRYESLERFWAGQIGLNAALNCAINIGIAKIQARIVELISYAKQKLEELGVDQIDNPDGCQSGLLLFRFENIPAADVRSVLQARDINVTVVQNRQTQLSSVYQEEGAAYVRISLHYFNTLREIDSMIAVLSGMNGAQRRR